MPGPVARLKFRPGQEVAAAPETDGELVHWMEPRRLTLGTTGISVATASAFALGALTAVTVLGLLHWVGPERELPRVRMKLRRRRRDE